MAEHSDPSEILTGDRVAELLGVHIVTAQRYFRTGGLPGRKVGRTWQTTRGALESWLTGGNAPDANMITPAGIQLPPLETK